MEEIKETLRNTDLEKSPKNEANVYLTMCFTSENPAAIKNTFIGLFWTLCVNLKRLISLFDNFIYLPLCAVLATVCIKFHKLLGHSHK